MAGFCYILSWNKKILFCCFIIQLLNCFIEMTKFVWVLYVCGGGGGGVCFKGVWVLNSGRMLIKSDLFNVWVKGYVYMKTPSLLLKHKHGWISPFRIICVWPVRAEVTPFHLGNDTMISSLSIDRHLNIKNIAWPKIRNPHKQSYKR